MYKLYEESRTALERARAFVTEHCGGEETTEAALEKRAAPRAPDRADGPTRHSGGHGEGAAAGRDEEDWPYLVSSPPLGCPIWSEDADFFGCGVAIWTSGKIVPFLEA